MAHWHPLGVLAMLVGGGRGDSDGRGDTSTSRRAAAGLARHSGPRAGPEGVVKATRMAAVGGAMASASGR